MELLFYLCEKFIKEEYFNIACIIILSLALSIFSTNIISNITANIIQGINKGSFDSVSTYYKYFILVSAIFFATYYLYKYFNFQIND